MRMLLNIIKNEKKNIFNIANTVYMKVNSRHFRANFQMLCIRGRRQMTSLASAERGSLMTTVCMNAGGHFVLPIIISNGKNMNTWGAPLGGIEDDNLCGWVQAHLFSQCFQYSFWLMRNFLQNHLL
jgi:hypothetical protein